MCILHIGRESQLDVSVIACDQSDGQTLLMKQAAHIRCGGFFFRSQTVINLFESADRESLRCLDAKNIAVGKTAVSTPMAEMTGRAIVTEHFPKQVMSWIVKILFIKPCLLSLFCLKSHCFCAHKASVRQNQEDCLVVLLRKRHGLLTPQDQIDRGERVAIR